MPKFLWKLEPYIFLWTSKQQRNLHSEEPMPKLFYMIGILFFDIFFISKTVIIAG